MANNKNLASTVMGVVLAVVIAGIMLGYVFPVGMDAATGDQSTSIIQEENVNYSVTTDLESEVTNIDTADETVTVELTYTESGVTDTHTLSEGDSATSTFDGQDVTVELQTYDDTEPTLHYEYPTDFGWGDGESNIFDVLTIFLVLVPLGVLAAYVMRSF